MEDPVADVAQGLNKMRPEELERLVARLEIQTARQLQKLLQQTLGGGENPWSHYVPSAAAPPFNRRHEPVGGYQQRPYNGEPRPHRGKASGKGPRGGAGPPAPLPPPLDQSESLPPCVPETQEPVAFQAGVGTPWRLTGPSGETFRWDLQDKNAVSADDKEEVKELLEQYATDHGIPVHGSGSVKLALRRGDYWISYAGGISSAAGRPNVPPPPSRPTPGAASGGQSSEPATADGPPPPLPQAGSGAAAERPQGSGAAMIKELYCK